MTRRVERISRSTPSKQMTYALRLTAPDSSRVRCERGYRQGLGPNPRDSIGPHRHHPSSSGTPGPAAGETRSSFPPGARPRRIIPQRYAAPTGKTANAVAVERGQPARARRNRARASSTCRAAPGPTRRDRTPRDDRPLRALRAFNALIGERTGKRPLLATEPRGLVVKREA